MALWIEIVLKPREDVLDDSKDFEAHQNCNLLIVEREISAKFHFIKALNLILMQK